MKFNSQNILKTSRFTLKIVTSACKVFDAGYYTEDAGLNINEVRHSPPKRLSRLLIFWSCPSLFRLLLSVMQQVIFNTLKVEAEATSQSAPSGTYKPSSNYFVLNPPKGNRSLSNLRSLKPQVVGPNGAFFYTGANGSTARAAVMDSRYENEPEDSEDDALNVTYTSLATGGDHVLKPKIEYASTNSRSGMTTLVNGKERWS